ncbi:hypothetical protein [Methylobacterium fujisawaense]|uniref:hypothetical protein n=1 Tax=Methylobacterium fujisawaense TaxID=107400 RepID=UPI003701BAEC
MKVAATSVSPIQLSHLTCAQIREEAGRVSARAAQAVGPQDEKRRSDQVATTVGAVIVLPALLFIDGDNHQTAELTRRKGAVKALEQASRLLGQARRPNAGRRNPARRGSDNNP